MVDIKQLTFTAIKNIAKREKYREIQDDYCHFVFQGYRVEAIRKIVCIVKGKSPKKTNDNSLYNDRIIYITDGQEEIVYDDILYKQFVEQFTNYLRKHRKYIRGIKNE